MECIQSTLYQLDVLLVGSQLQGLTIHRQLGIESQGQDGAYFF